MIHISKNAQKYFLKLLSKKKTNFYIQLYVDNPGMYNAKCKISYISKDATKQSNIKLKLDLMSIYIDKTSAPYLKNTKIDIINKPLGPYLTIQTPNINSTENHTDRKYASLDKCIEHVLEHQINPQLKYHGGEVKLIKVTKELLVVLQFKGGCNGCAMASYTLKNGIEKTLVNLFPEIKGIQDITEHKHGTHSFY